MREKAHLYMRRLYRAVELANAIFYDSKRWHFWHVLIYDDHLLSGGVGQHFWGPCAMPYEIEELAMFWKSLDELDSAGDSKLIAQIIDALASSALLDPRRARANSDGIRVLKAPSMTLGEVVTPALRLAYHLEEQRQPSGADGVVTLLHVQLYDEAEELLAGLAPTGPEH